MQHKEPAMRTAVVRGIRCTCPACGKGPLFRKFVKVAETCTACGEELFHHRADDMPAYVVMSIVGHIVIGAMLWAEIRYAPPLWLHSVVWFPLTIGLALGLLQPVKGAIVALQWKLGMHGFGTRRTRFPDIATAST